jgi:sigma-B regulation protein RsbU (phosphoserine phosphatase)
MLSPDNYHGGILADKEGTLLTPREVLTSLNQKFYSKGADEYFSIIYGIVDTSQKTVTLSRAGQTLPLLIRQDGYKRIIKSKGNAVGISDDNFIQQVKFESRHGGRIFLYSDGIVECHNPDGRQFSFSRLENLLQSGGKTDLRELTSSLERTLSEWRGKEQFDDDISFLAMEMQ